MIIYAIENTAWAVIYKSIIIKGLNTGFFLSVTQMLKSCQRLLKPNIFTIHILAETKIILFCQFHVELQTKVVVLSFLLPNHCINV